MEEVERRRIGARGVLRMLADERDGTTVAVAPREALPPDLEIPDAFRNAVQRSETGAVLFWSVEEAHLVIPPFPVASSARTEGWDVELLREILERPRRVGVLLLRLGGYAVGIFEGDELVSSKVGSRFVKGRHGKGGSSQARFARRREEQAKALYRKACEVLRARLDAYPRPLDHFVCGGDKRTLAAFAKECPVVDELEPIRLHRVLDVGDPKRATLEALPGKLTESRVLTVWG